MRFKLSTTWTTDPLFIKQDTDYYFYQNDHLGTPQKLTAINGAVVWAAKYSSFGKATVDPASTVINNLRFPGQVFDEETELHYNYFRYYDPTNGRYLRADPIGLAGGINLYSYVFNNPVVGIDPKGKGVKDVILCMYYSRKVAKYLEACGEELEQFRKRRTDCSLLGDIKFMQKYNSQWLSEALAKCAVQKSPDKKLAYKWFKNCFKAGWTPPHVPTR